MRVITGSARGRRLYEPKDNSIRPTTEQVKEAVFSVVQFDVPGRRVLDLFAGTGQLGIEALSRGAAECVFVDRDPAAVALVRKNLEVCGFDAQVFRTDSLAYLSHCGKFDLVFIDPPYHDGLYENIMQNIFRFDILSVGGIILVESMRGTELPPAQLPYLRVKDYTYGRVCVTKYMRGTET